MEEDKRHESPLIVQSNKRDLHAKDLTLLRAAAVTMVRCPRENQAPASTVYTYDSLQPLFRQRKNERKW